MNRILILGSSGFLGSNLVKYFLSKNFEVGAYSRSGNIKEKGLKIHKHSILDYDALDVAVSDYDIVINCTGQVTNPMTNCIQMNIEGIDNIIDTAKKHDCYLVHLSTVAVYGDSANEVFEESDINPSSMYGFAKYFAEYKIQQKLTQYAILRISNMYGQNQTKGILSYIVKSYHNNIKNIFFNNNGMLKRYYLLIDDLSCILEKIILKNLNGIYNIIGNDFLTIRDIIKICEDELNFIFNVTYKNKEPIDNVFKINNDKINNEINYKCNSIRNYIKKISYASN